MKSCLPIISEYREFRLTNERSMETREKSTTLIAIVNSQDANKVNETVSHKKFVGFTTFFNLFFSRFPVKYPFVKKEKKKNIIQ